MSRIKICGLTRSQDVEAVNQYLPDYIGFVFAVSKRQVSLQKARHLKAELSPRVLAVGVFVDHPLQEILSLTEDGTIDLIQLHGNEDEVFIRQVKAVTGKPVIKAVSVREPGDITEWQDSEADYLLFDCGRGGTGETFDWNCLKQSEVMKKPYFLAGGLNGENLNAALAFAPYCVDISSGAEHEGRKDRDQIRKLIEMTRAERV